MMALHRLGMQVGRILDLIDNGKTELRTKSNKNLFEIRCRTMTNNLGGGLQDPRSKYFCQLFVLGDHDGGDGKRNLDVDLFQASRGQRGVAAGGLHHLRRRHVVKLKQEILFKTDTKLPYRNFVLHDTGR